MLLGIVDLFLTCPAAILHRAIDQPCQIVLYGI